MYTIFDIDFFHIFKSRGIWSVRLCLYSGLLQGKNLYLSKERMAEFWYQLEAINKEFETPPITKILFQSMIRQIDKSLKNRDNSVRGLMANEIHKHLDLCVERNEDFLGRDVDLYKVIINSR